MDNHFVILVTQRNAVSYIRKCLDTVIAQTYKGYEVIIMDDASDDGTWEIIQKEYSQFQAVHTMKQPYYITNFYAAINLMATNPEDIVVLVCGDDYLYSDDVFEHLNTVYQDDIWLTYGNFIRTSGLHGKGCFPIPDTREYRKKGDWLASHLVTFKKKLYDQIKKEDLLYVDGNFPNHSYDCSILYPMIEMCGQRHMHFVDKVLYVYNDQNPLAIAEYKKDKKACLRERAYWMSKDKYPELTTL
jgi:glycosyltransferase involved in cell wall biosynthesis